MATLTLTLTGPAEVLADLVPVFASAHGWTPALGTSPNQHARDVFARFLRDSVTAEVVKIAQRLAAAAAGEQAEAAADTLTLTIS